MRRLTGFLIMLTGVIAGGSRVSLCGQEQDGMIKYTPDFRFTDGIYIDFNQVKNNSPVLKTKIITFVDYNSKDFFSKLLVEKEISYYDDPGVKKEAGKDDLWGYTDNGIVHIQIQGNFSPLTFMGKICHVIAEIKLNDTIYYDPATGSYLDFYDKYGYPYKYYDPYYNRYVNSYTRRHNYRQLEPEPGMERNQYLLDFETGELWEYDVQGVKTLIKKDTVLYEEYRKLRNRMKKRMMFSYIRRYNERNPLSVPEATSD